MDAPIPYGPEHLASAGQRFVGRFVDQLFLVGSVFVAAFVARAADLDPGPTGILVTVLLLPYVGVQGMLAHLHGQSLGKKLAGTRVVLPSGRQAGFFRGFFFRDGLILVAGATRIFGLINALMVFNSTRRCGHDHMLGTMVVDASAVPHADAERIADVFR